MPTPINNAAAASALAALIRNAVAGSKPQGGAGKTAKRGANRADQPKRPTSDPSLPAMIAARVQEIDPDAPEFRSRMLRLVVEAALLHEFGSNLINAPRFQGMVDQILHELESAPQLQRDVDALLQGMRTGRWGESSGSGA